MTQRSKPANPSSLLSGTHVPLLLLAAFLLGAVGMWLIMRSPSSGSSSQVNPPAEKLLPSPATGPPDVSQFAPADAAKILGDWNYDRHNWAHAIDHYQQAITAGADNPDVRTDLGNCFRFIGQPEKALEQYQIAQAKNPMHENSLLNQAGLYADLLHDDQRAVATAREFLKRFPQSDRAALARQLISNLEARERLPEKP
jgi:tetratricopeptide (TPR) repeat protein